MQLFVRLTLTVAAAIVAFFILLILLKVVVFAAVVAGLILAGLFVTNFVRSFLRLRRSQLTVGNYPSGNLPVR